MYERAVGVGEWACLGREREIITVFHILIRNLKCILSSNRISNPLQSQHRDKGVYHGRENVMVFVHHTGDGENSIVPEG